MVRLGEREWAVAAAMDGTRGVAGIAEAATRRGATIGSEVVETFVAELAAAGLLEEAPGASAPPAQEIAPAMLGTPAERPLEPLPDTTFDCDGQGSCCRVYPTIVFLGRDVVRARAGLPDVLAGGDDEASAFTPVAGSVDPTSTPALVDGRCMYLAGDGRCGVHGALGPAAKPFGCRTFPLTYVDDGSSVRVVPRPECACVPRSASGAASGGPLVAPGVLVRGHLPPETFVHRLPERIALTRDVVVPVAELAVWSRALGSVQTPDAAAALAALADVVGRGLDAARDVALAAAPPALDPARCGPHLRALREAAAGKMQEGWRSPRDLAQQSFVALDTACDLALAAPEMFAAGPRSEREREAEALHVRTVLFGHLCVADDAAVVLADELERRSAQVVAARALGAVAELAGLTDPAYGWPLALLEALVRGHGLARR